MRGGSKFSPEAAAREFVPADNLALLDFQKMFGRSAPVEIDLGCGDGNFLCALASQQPNVNHLGVERMFGRSRSACRKLAAAGLTNARVLRGEISSLLAQMIPAGSVAAFYLLFPDPWPKRRHHSRRVVTRDFLRLIHAALAPAGKLLIVTDQPEYFRAIEFAAQGLTGFDLEMSDGSDGMPKSTFEQRYESGGTHIHRLVLRKVSLVR